MELTNDGASALGLAAGAAILKKIVTRKERKKAAKLKYDTITVREVG